MEIQTLGIFGCFANFSKSVLGEAMSKVSTILPKCIHRFVTNLIEIFYDF